MRFIIGFLLFLSQAFCYAQPLSVRVYNNTQNKIIVEKNSTDTRSIASVTKLMTAMVYLDQHNELSTKIHLTSAIKSNLPKQQYTRHDLLNAMLVKSDNAAAESLAADYNGGRELFIIAMNEKAKALGMVDTKFTDASGLNSTNVSTALDISKMLLEAHKYQYIIDISTKKQTEIETQKKNKLLTLRNTNVQLLNLFDNIELSKTGFTTPAGFCVAFVIKQGSEIFTVVILGSKNLKERLDVAKYLVSNYIKDFKED